MDLAGRNKLNELAARQLGLLTRAQLYDHGVEQRMIRRRVHAGLLLPAGRQTFLVAGAPVSFETEVLAGCLDLGAVASHRTAAWCHGLRRWPAVIDLTVLKHSGRVRSHRVVGMKADLVVRATTSLPAADVIDVRGIPTTSVARTMLGLAALVPHELSQVELLQLVAKAVDERLATEAWLWWLLERRRCRGRNGVAAMEGALAELCRLGPTESWLERALLRVLELQGLPLPRTQRVVQRRGRFVARVDVAYDDEALVVEALGYAFHRTKEQMEADLARANEIQLTGRAVLQFTTSHIVERPAWVARTIADLRRTRSRLGARRADVVSGF